MMRLLAGALLLILAGCISVPDAPGDIMPPAASDPGELVEGFRAAVPGSFHLLSSIVFEYNFHSLSGLGYLSIDASGRYKVMCMNQLGVTLFAFQGDRDGLISQYAIGPLARQGNISAVVGEDIRRIYLDLLPLRDSQVTKRKRAIFFRQRSGDGAMEYEFSGPGPKLARKTFREDHRAVWRVSYREWRMKDGKLIPMDVVFQNFRYGYRLIVRVKEIRG